MTYTIKPLLWRIDREGHWVAVTPMAYFHCYDDQGKWRAYALERADQSDDLKVCDTEHEAKAWLEQQHVTQMERLLEPVTPVVL